MRRQLPEGVGAEHQGEAAGAEAGGGEVRPRAPQRLGALEGDEGAHEPEHHDHAVHVGEPRRPDATASASALVTSRNSGSPPAPGSLVRSRTAMRVAVWGIAAISSSTGNGR